MGAILARPFIHNNWYNNSRRWTQILWARVYLHNHKTTVAHFIQNIFVENKLHILLYMSKNNGETISHHQANKPEKQIRQYYI